MKGDNKSGYISIGVYPVKIKGKCLNLEIYKSHDGEMLAESNGDEYAIFCDERGYKAGYIIAGKSAGYTYLYADKVIRKGDK